MTSPRTRRSGALALVIAVLAIVAVSVAVGVVRALAAPASVESVPEVTGDAAEEATDAAGTASTPAAELRYVHVSGAVAHPGVFALRPGDRVVDAVTAAGGFTDDADLSAINLAREPEDGEQVHVPVVGEGAPPQTAESGTALVNLNTADATALESLPGIGPVLAERIVAWRDANGAFTAVEDLLAVSGIGAKLLDGLRELVTV